MTNFEQILLDKGYIKFRLNSDSMKLEKEKDNKHTISTMVNLDYRYIHNIDIKGLEKIEKGLFVTWEDIKSVIIFGLHEVGKPPTLIYPRPKIEIKRIKNNEEVIENEVLDDSMNVVLSKRSFDEIFKAMYDNTITIKIDLTK